MKEGNAGGLLIYFQKQQAKNPSFLYSMQRILKMQMYLKDKDGNNELIIGDNLNNLNLNGLKKKDHAPSGKHQIKSSCSGYSQQLYSQLFMQWLH